MARRRSGAQARKTGRRWHIPPPLVHGSEALEGGEVLREASGSEGVLLWQALRDCTLWAQTPPEARGELFSAGAAQRARAQRAGAGLEGEVAGALEEVEAVLWGGNEGEEGRVAEACRRLGESAEGAGKLATALGFRQAAALAEPGDAHAAYQVARLARQRADHARAEVWYRRAIGLARQARDWRMYSLAFRSLGNLYAVRGNFPVARKLQMRALRGARRGGMRGEQGQALHDLFGIAIETGSTREAAEFARLAFEAYRPRNEKLPRLAHDIAYFWMEQGDFARALVIFEALVPLFDRPVDRLFVSADLARAAAGTGDTQRFERYWREAWVQIDEHPDALDGAARALVDLARGASIVRDWERAEQAARRALTLATEREEAKIQFAAEAVLDAARRQQALTESGPAAAIAAAPESSEELTIHLLEALHALAVSP